MISIDFDSHIPVGTKVKLSAIIDADSFVYAIFQENNILSSFGRCKLAESNSFVQHLKESYKVLEVKYASMSPLFMHVPKEEIFEISPLDKMENLYDEKIKVVYDIKYHKAFDTLHSSTLFNRFYFGKLGNVMHLHLLENLLVVYVAIDGEMILYNQYDIENEVDLAYFSNLVFQALKLDENNTKVVLSGMINEKSIYHRVVQTYFHNVVFFNSEQFTTTDEEQFRKSYYFDHFINLMYG